MHIIPEQLTARTTTLEDAERQAIVDTLQGCGGDKKRAAEQLNISLRTLYRKIREYGIES